MLAATASFRPILLAAMFMMMGHGLTSTALSVRLAQLDASAQIAGLVTTAYFLGMVVGTRFGHRLLLRTGHIRGFAATVAGAGLSILMLPIIPDPVAWIIFRFIGGVCIVLALLVLESWLNIAADNAVRGSVFGAYMVVVYVGMTVGQAVLGVLDVGSFEAFSIAAIAMMLAVQPLAFTRLSQPVLPPSARLRLIDLVRISPVGIAAAVGSGALTGAMFGLFPFYASSVGLSAGGIAVFMSAVIGGGLVLNGPLGWLSDRVDRRFVVVAAAAVIIGASIVLALGDQNIGTLVWAGGLIGGVTAALYSLGVAHTNDQVGGGDAIAVGAGLLLAFGVGAIVGPILASAAMDWTGAIALFAYTGLIGLCLLALTIYRLASKAAVSPEEKGDFVTLSGAAPAAFVVDPGAAETPDESGIDNPPT